MMPTNGANCLTRTFYDLQYRILCFKLLLNFDLLTYAAYFVNANLKALAIKAAELGFKPSSSLLVMVGNHALFSVMSDDSVNPENHLSHQLQRLLRALPCYWEKSFNGTMKRIGDLLKV
ncbi:hypothetical protein D918_07620 [Trichuris suis]|nr:hypothetical protein D918_07620 [Trichuris suis]